MDPMLDEKLTRTERKLLSDFWAVRYHNQSLAPVTMSVADDNGQIRNEGGYGSWDADSFSKYVTQVSKQSQKLQGILLDTRENPESPNHPVTKIFLERQEALKKERTNSISADRERLDLQLRSEKASWQSWAAQEKNNIFPGAFDRDVKKYDREKNAAFGELYQYDKSFNHPLTDPDRNLQKDPPTFGERRDWLLHRNAINQEKYGNRERSFDINNDREQNALGMTPKNWLNEQEQIDRDRIAPQRSGSILPKQLSAIVDQRKEIDKMLATERNSQGQAVHNDWEKSLPKRHEIDQKRTLDHKQEEKIFAQVSANQSTPMVSVADASRSHNSAPALIKPEKVKTQFHKNMANYRNNLKDNIQKIERQPTVGQELSNAIVAQRPRNALKEQRLEKEEQDKQNIVFEQQRKDQDAREAVLLKKAHELREMKNFAIPEKSPERKEAEKIALYYKQKVDAGTANIHETKMSNPNYVQKMQLLQKNKPKTLNEKTQDFVQDKVNWFKEAVKNDQQSLNATREKLTGALGMLSQKMKTNLGVIREQATEVVRDVARSIQQQTLQPAMASNTVLDFAQRKPFPKNPMRVKNAPVQQTQVRSQTQQPSKDNGVFSFVQKLFPKNPMKVNRQAVQQKQEQTRSQSQNSRVENSPIQNQERSNVVQMKKVFPKNPMRQTTAQPVQKQQHTPEQSRSRKQ